ncbi:hypothetical protein [Herbiconiux liangxiaofengii]|uniref:hypothetical protein n=1 Tax=Herbiconiux liangxiaofengii TaxID=3342795 RepID=UPI0035B98B7A
MDSNLLAIIAILIAVSIVGMLVFRRWMRRKLRTVAAERKVTAVPGMLEEFGRSVVLGTDPAATQAMIAALPKRKAKELSPGVWGLNYVSRDDVVIEVHPTAGTGSEVLVTSLREHFGFPQGLHLWKAFTEQLQQSAAASGVSVQRGSHAFQAVPAPANTLDDAHWVLSN